MNYFSKVKTRLLAGTVGLFVGGYSGAVKFQYNQGVDLPPGMTPSNDEQAAAYLAHMESAGIATDKLVSFLKAPSALEMARAFSNSADGPDSYEADVEELVYLLGLTKLEVLV